MDVGPLVAHSDLGGVYFMGSVKRSEALWGHNLTRDNRVDGASMTYLGAFER